MNIKRLASIIGLPIVGLLILILIGTILFSFFEKIDLFNAFYWTITVLSTVGFGDITPKTFAGKILFIFIIVFGLALFGYFITQISSLWSEERAMKVIQGIYGFIKTDGGRLHSNNVLASISGNSFHIVKRPSLLILFMKDLRSLAFTKDRTITSLDFLYHGG